MWTGWTLWTRWTDRDQRDGRDRWDVWDKGGGGWEREVRRVAGGEVFAFWVSDFHFMRDHHPDDFFRVGEKALFSGRIEI